MTEPALHSFALAAELARRLSPVQAVVGELSRLNPNVHVHPTFAIVVTAGETRHVLALVSGTKVEIDGPRPSTPAYRYVKTEEALTDTAQRLAGIASAWLEHEPQVFGVYDLAVTLLTALAAHDVVVAMDATLQNASASVSVRRGGVAWPAGLTMEATEAGVRLRCGPLDRVVRVIADLSDFEQREESELIRQIAACEAILAGIARAKPFAERLALELARRFPERSWDVATDEAYFSLTTAPAAYVVWIMPDGARTTIVSFDHGVDGTLRAKCGPTAVEMPPDGFDARIEELVVAADASTREVRPNTLVRGHRYRVTRAFADARAGDLLTFREVIDVPPTGEDVWFFAGPKDRTVKLGWDHPKERAVLQELRLYLERAEVE